MRAPLLAGISALILCMSGLSPARSNSTDSVLLKHLNVLRAVHTDPDSKVIEAQN